MQWKNGYFYNDDGSRYVPLGMFGCYFRGEYVNEEVRGSQHGSGLIEFQNAPRSVWKKFFRFLAEEDGCTAIRMFPRGNSGGAAWEGLDIGGKVNKALLDTIRAYMEDAREFGIRLQLCLFTEPECSFYCQRNTRTYWGRRLWKKDEIANAAPSQRRFLDNPDDIVSYSDFFSDPDVRDCCHRFLDEILPMLKDFPDLYALEVFNESGWASPHADPANTFRWEDTPAYLDWHRDMVDHIRRVWPEMPVCISNAGVSILGHDTVHWCREIRPDFFSFHNYPDICGARPGMDYAAVTDMVLQYTAASVPTIMGEWQAIPVRYSRDPRHVKALPLLSRDVAWMTLLSGAGGCISWQARGYGQYHAVRDIMPLLNGYAMEKDTVFEIDITEAQGWLESLWKKGADECVYPPHRWCPDAAATDKGHRFCIKSESDYYQRLLDVQQWSMETGIPFRFSLTGGRPLMEVTKADFAAFTPYLAPIAGYQQKAFSADNGALRLVYLRNTENCPVMHKDFPDVESFSLRLSAPVPAVLSGIDPAYRARLYDLNTRQMTEIDPAAETGLGVTDHDYILILEKKN